MKNLARLAVLGAAFAAAAPFACATSLLSGTILTQDSPAAATFSGGVFALNSVTYALPNPPISGEPTENAGGTAELGAYGSNMVFDLFATSSPADTAIWSGTSSATGDTLTFHASSFTAPMQDPNNGQIDFTINGYFTSSSSLFLQTSGYDTVTLNVGANGLADGNLTEDLTAVAPEPSSLLLLGTGLVSAAGILVRRSRSLA